MGLILNQARLILSRLIFMTLKKALTDLHASKHSHHKDQGLQVPCTQSNECWPWAKACYSPARPKNEASNN
jgi:hypothetical protein